MNTDIDKIKPPHAPEVPPSPAEPLPDLNPFFRNDLHVDILAQTGFHSGPRPRRRGYRLAAWSWLAALIDTLVLISVSCVFLLVFSLVMRTQAGTVMAGLRGDRSLAENFLQVFLLSSWIYMIALRVWMGSSVGEWTCDLRLGRLQDRMQSRYVLQVILRESLILATGLVLLPLLSLIWGRDLAGKISGISLFSLK